MYVMNIFSCYYSVSYILFFYLLIYYDNKVNFEVYIKSIFAYAQIFVCFCHEVLVVKFKSLDFFINNKKCIKMEHFRSVLIFIKK